MDNNICRLALGEGWQSTYTLVFYSHLIPTLIAAMLAFFVLYKSNYSLLSKIFFVFATSFCFWLIGDTFVWTSTDFQLISFFWAPLDYLNIIFYLAGAYFFTVLVNEKDIKSWQKVILVLLALPAWLVTITNNSITAFNEPVCEALNNEILSQYKLFVEVLVVAYILFFGFFKGRKNSGRKLLEIIVVACALVLFFSVFSVTEYISSQTGIYEINLYSLFVLPVFLFLITYSISNLEIFKIRLIGFQLLAYALIIMVGSQFFFLQNSTNRLLTIITFIMSLGFGVLLVRSGRREVQAREKVEKLAAELENANAQLKELDKQKDELLSLVSHQLAAPISAIRWYIEMLLDGDLGAVNDEQKTQLQTVQVATQNLNDLVSMILDVSRVQLGRINIQPQELDLNEFFKEILDVVEPKAVEKQIKFIKTISTSLPKAFLDRRYTRMTIENLLTNAIKYTPVKGEVSFLVEIRGQEMFVKVQDTGCGIPADDQKNIFGKMFRASNVRNSTIDGNGFGLYIAKGSVETQGGKIWFESEEGKGTTFYVILPLRSSLPKQD